MGSGQSQTISNSVSTTMMTNAVLDVTTNCIQDVNVNQIIDLSQQTLPAGFEDKLNEGATYCRQVLLDIWTARQNLEREAVSRGGTAPKHWAAIQTMMVTGTAINGDVLGPCDLIGFDMVVDRLSQKIKSVSSTSCTVNTDYTNKITQNIQGQMDSSIANTQDALGQIEGQLSGRSQKLSADLSSTLTQNITTKILSSLLNRLELTQKMQINRSNSMYASRLTQSIDSRSIASMSVTSNIVNQLTQSAQYTIAQTAVNENDTTGLIIKNILAMYTAIADMMDDVVTQTLIIVGMLILTAACVFGTLFFFSPRARYWAHTTLGVAELHVAQALSNPQTGTIPTYDEARRGGLTQ